MSLYSWAIRLVWAFEDRIVETILRRPGFHRAVGKIHKTIDERQNGRHPNQPLAPGEATANPNASSSRQDFAKHFYNELKNQFRGKPTDWPPQPPQPPQAPKK